MRGNGRNKLRTYSLFKNTYTEENYVKLIMQRTHRSAFAKFRMGVAPLRIDTGRYERLEENERVCFTCDDAVESEEHVLLPFISRAKRILAYKDNTTYTRLLFKNESGKTSLYF